MRRHVNYPYHDFASIDYVERYYTPCSAKYFTPEEEAFVNLFVHRYAVPERPSKVSLYEQMRCAMHELNEQRMALGIPPLRSPSRATFNRRIVALPEHVIRFGRYGRPRRPR